MALSTARRDRAKKAAVPSIQPCQPHRRRGAITLFRVGRDTSLPERGPNAGTMDQVRPQVGSWHQTTRTLDWSTYPLKPHQVAASAPTPDRSTNPAERMTRKWRDDLTNPGPLQKPNFNTIGRELLAVHYRVHALMFQAMMPGLRPAEIKRLK